MNFIIMIIWGVCTHDNRKFCFLSDLIIEEGIDEWNSESMIICDWWTMMKFFGRTDERIIQIKLLYIMMIKSNTQGVGYV